MKSILSKLRAVTNTSYMNLTMEKNMNNKKLNPNCLVRPQYVEDKKPTRKWETKDKYLKRYYESINHHYNSQPRDLTY